MLAQVTMTSPAHHWRILTIAGWGAEKPHSPGYGAVARRPGAEKATL
jgi:hypothetical protein